MEPIRNLYVLLSGIFLHRRSFAKGVQSARLPASRLASVLTTSVWILLPFSSLVSGPSLKAFRTGPLPRSSVCRLPPFQLGSLTHSNSDSVCKSTAGCQAKGKDLLKDDFYLVPWYSYSILQTFLLKTICPEATSGFLYQKYIFNLKNFLFCNVDTIFSKISM